MKTKRVNASRNNCNFCQRGELHDDGTGLGLQFPYTEVTEVSGGFNGGLTVYICDQCLTEMQQIKIGNEND